MSIQTLSKSPPVDAEDSHSGNGSPRPTENYGSYLQKYQYSSWPESGKDSPPKTNTQSSTMSTMIYDAVDFIAKMGGSIADATKDTRGERWELQPGTSQWEYKTVGRYVNGRYVICTETVYKPAQMEYVYKRGNGSKEEKADTSIIDDVGRMGATAALCVLVAAVGYSLLKELK